MRILRTLFVGGRDGFSLARTAFWICFAFHMFRLASQGQDIPPGHLTLILGLLGYILYGKTSKFKLGPGNAVTLESSGNDSKP